MRREDSEQMDASNVTEFKFCHVCCGAVQAAALRGVHLPRPELATDLHIVWDGLHEREVWTCDVHSTHLIEYAQRVGCVGKRIEIPVHVH